MGEDRSAQLSMKRRGDKKAEVAGHGLQIHLVLLCSPTSYLNACSQLSAFPLTSL